MCMKSLDYCRQLARSNAYGEYVCMLTLKPASRRRVLPLIALDAELRQVAAKVREEMLAHIRYAWWRENIVAKKAPEHPVLQALAGAGAAQESLAHMIDEAQTAWPKIADTHAALHAAVMASLDASGQERWQRGLQIVEKHGQSKKWVLPLKILFSFR